MPNSNIDHLRDILNGMELEKTDEAIEFLDAIEEELTNKTDKITNLEEELAEHESAKEDEENEESLTMVNLGLDKIHYRLEDGNLLIQQKLERAFKAINTVPYAEVI